MFMMFIQCLQTVSTFNRLLQMLEFTPVKLYHRKRSAPVDRYAIKKSTAACRGTSLVSCGCLETLVISQGMNNGKMSPDTVRGTEK